MKNYFTLIFTNKSFRTYNIIALVLWLFLVVGSIWTTFYSIRLNTNSDLDELVHHYQIEIKNIETNLVLLDLLFDDQLNTINQSEFSEHVIQTLDFKNINYVAIDNNGDVELVYPLSMFESIEDENTFDDRSPVERSELLQAIEDNEVVFQYNISNDQVTEVLARKPLYDKGNFYGFITISFKPDFFSTEQIAFHNVYIVSGLLTEDSYLISGEYYSTATRENIIVGESEIVVSAKVRTSYLIQAIIEVTTFLLIVLITMLISLIFIYRGFMKNIQLENDLEYRKNYDKDTDLYNVERLYSDLRYLVKQTDVFFVAFLTINNLKFINERFGYQMTKELLKKTTGLINRVLRQNSTLYRYGGDEYVITIKTDSDSEVKNTLRRISKIFENDITSGNINARLGLSVGVTKYPDHGKTEELLIKNSHFTATAVSRYDKEVYKFYEESKMRSLFTTDEFDQKVKDLNLELFEVYLMPIVDVKTNKISGFECLTRAFDDFGNSLHTEEVVLSLERNGRIQELDEIVFRKMLQILKRINEEFPDEEYFLSLNASALSINDEYIKNIVKYYKQAHLKKGQIVLELTESYQVEDYDYLIRLFNELIANGINVAIDDFGSGYSSISYISKFPIYAIKIDKQYVSDYDTNSFNRTLFMTLKSIAEVLGCKLVAEGVDSIETLAYLKDMDCPFYQGYLFSKGVPLNNAITLIKENIKSKNE